MNVPSASSRRGVELVSSGIDQPGTQTSCRHECVPSGALSSSSSVTVPPIGHRTMPESLVSRSHPRRFDGIMRVPFDIEVDVLRDLSEIAGK